ncbi:MAG: hypothetical protein ACO3VI_12630, partial [Ilumatobacteraceae bacterium]
SADWPGFTWIWRLNMNMWNLLAVGIRCTFRHSTVGKGDCESLAMSAAPRSRELTLPAQKQSPSDTKPAEFVERSSSAIIDG